MNNQDHICYSEPRSVHCPRCGNLNVKPAGASMFRRNGKALQFFRINPDGGVVANEEQDYQGPLNQAIAVAFTGDCGHNFTVMFNCKGDEYGTQVSESFVGCDLPKPAIQPPPASDVLGLKIQEAAEEIFGEFFAQLGLNPVPVGAEDPIWIALIAFVKTTNRPLSKLLLLAKPSVTPTGLILDYPANKKREATASWDNRTEIVEAVAQLTGGLPELSVTVEGTPVSP